MEIKTGFARASDGVQLYYRVVGTGPPIACCNGVGVSTFFYKYVVQHFSTDHSVLVWDYRGHGRSQRPPSPPTADLSIERNAHDLAAVFDAAGFDTPAVLLGHSMGCQVILEFARQYPARVSGLVPMFGTYARPLDTFLDWPHSRLAFDILRRLADAGGKVGTRLVKPLYANSFTGELGRVTGVIDRFYADKVDIDKYLEHMEHMDAQVFLRMVHLMADHDMSDFLPQIPVPTLVIAGERDIFTPLHRSHAMAEAIPGAELMVLAEASHAAIVEDPDTINLRIRRFLTERVYAG
ncbi:MAG: pimeloyl-ACP methyl ester carboxylesterase [Myxococcota bacterium]